MNVPHPEHDDELAPRDQDENAGKISFGKIDHRRLSREEVSLERGFFFGMVENGSALIVDDSGTRPLRRGDLLILSPSRSCSVRNSSKDFIMIRIGMDPDFFDTLPDAQTMYNSLVRHREGSLPSILHPEPLAYEHLRDTALLYAHAMAPFEKHRPGIVRHWCGLFLLQLSDILREDDAPGQDADCIRRADKLFRAFKRLSVEHFRTHHDIAFYADRLHISPTYLARIVKRITGHTVYTHLAGLLCAEARRYLRSSDISVKEIADRLGFADQSSFGKFFKAQIGLSPNHFRQRVGYRQELKERSEE